MPYYKPHVDTIDLTQDGASYTLDGATESPVLRYAEELCDLGHWQRSDKPFGKAKAAPKLKLPAEPAGKSEPPAPAAAVQAAIDPEDYVKRVLVEAARQLDVDDGGTKAEIAARLSDVAGAKDLLDALTDN